MQLTRLFNVKPCSADCVLISSVKRAVDVSTTLTQAVRYENVGHNSNLYSKLWWYAGKARRCHNDEPPMQQAVNCLLQVS